MKGLLKKYDSSKSTTFKDTGKNYTLPYLSGIINSGILSQDTINVAGMSVQNQVFEAVTTNMWYFGGYYDVKIFYLKLLILNKCLIKSQNILTK